MKFTTIFLQTKNEHLTKDIGAIPFFLKKEFGYDSEIVTYNNDEYKNHEGPLKSLRLRFIPRSVLGQVFDGLLFLKSNAKKIDVLNLYHLSIKTALWAYVYKRLNSNGILYLKTDASFLSVEKIEKSFIRKKIIAKLIDLSNITSVESTPVLERLKKNIDREYVLIPNGFFDIETRKAPNKKKIILFVGRVDAPEKNVELLIKAFLNTNIYKEWELRIVGPYSESFRETVFGFMSSRTEAKEHVILCGPIYDRSELDKLYDSASVFVLPSKYESYGIVLVEALKSGCYLIGSENVPPFREITKNFKYGESVDIYDIDSFSNVLEVACNNHLNDNERVNEQIKYAIEKYSWSSIVRKLDELIKAC